MVIPRSFCALALIFLCSKSTDAFSTVVSSIVQPKTATFTSAQPHNIQSKSLSSLRATSIDTPTTDEIAGSDISADPKPQPQYDSIVCGGGPAGLLAAIMLSQKYGPSHRIAVCERRPATPPSPSDNTVWSDVARFYLLGIGHRGQRALNKFGVFDDFVKASVAVNGRRDWQPGATKVEDGRITPAKKDVVSRVLPRDKLVGVLYHHILENYAHANIDLLYGYQVDPISFESAQDGVEDCVTVQISKCEDILTKENAADGDKTYAASQESDQLCDVDSFTLSTTKLLIGADGSARTVANAMERMDEDRISKINPLLRPFAQKPFKVTRFVDDNPRVYKSVPIKLPSDWPADLNYSARSRESRITLEALPSDDQGNLCALLLMKPDDELAKANVDPAKLRTFFDEEFPQFGALIDDDEMARVAIKDASALPAFRYAGPRLNLGRRTLILGDAAHTVKPYYGLGANSALEDVQMLSDALDEAAVEIDGTDDAVPKAVKLFSDRRAPDSEALVTISRNMDRPGKLFFFTFVLPLILDGIFHKIAPKIFGPNMFAMFQRQDINFKQIQKKKRLDRTVQFALLGSIFTAMIFAADAGVSLLARVTGKTRGIVAMTMVMAAAVGSFLRKLASSRTKEIQESK
mmetsp:Transcript_14518/g.20493  ORF Transcript_14518/g.20493 Transcript_14518/m.20493 type:complete len:636 (-) Transcript_14518:149-2056(-)